MSNCISNWFTCTFSAQFGVQGITLDGRGGNMKVTCTFAAGVDGCKVAIVGEGGLLRQMGAVLMNEEKLSAKSVIFTGLNNGTYLVVAADVQADGTFNPTYQPSTQFYTVIDAPSFFPTTTPTSNTTGEC